MTLRLTAGRDRSGRAPRASRDHAFYQSVADWSVPGEPSEIDTPVNVINDEPYHTDDEARGSGY
jgi:hypothetical protein